MRPAANAERLTTNDQRPTTYNLRRTFIETCNKTRWRCGYSGYAGISGFVPGRSAISRRQKLGPGGDWSLGWGEASAGEVGRRFGKGSGWIAGRDHIHHSS